MGSEEGSTMRFHSLYRSPNIVRVIKYRRWIDLVGIEEGRSAFKTLISKINTKKYHVFAPMGRFQLELINSKYFGC